MLEALETVLLSPSGRERIHAIATFTLIFLFALTSIDFLISGGPEFGAPARAQRPALVQSAPVVAEPAPPERAAADVPTEVASSLAQTRAATVIAVSQSFERPTVRRAEPTADLTVGPADEEPLVGERAADAPPPIASDVSRERKRKLSGR